MVWIRPGAWFRPLLMVTLLALCALPAGAADYWGRTLPDQPTQFIFGYGTLINSASRNGTAGKPISAVPVRVSAEFGYLRAWVARSQSGFTALGLRRPRAGERADTINGVLYPVDGTDMAPFDRREKGYVRVGLPLSQVEPVSWQALPRGEIHIWVYVPVGTDGKAGETLPLPDAAFPLLESYIDLVLDGALEYGSEFARELLATTHDWSEFWLNDRSVGRRPWVYDKNHGEEDELLAQNAPASLFFKHRTFPEEFSARHLMPRLLQLDAPQKP